MPRCNHHTICRRLVLLAALALLAGCASTQTPLERNFGSSVRNMIERQTAPPGYRGFGMEGPKAEAVLENYRKDVAESKKVEESTLRIQVGK